MVRCASVDPKSIYQSSSIYMIWMIPRKKPSATGTLAQCGRRRDRVACEAARYPNPSTNLLLELRLLQNGQCDSSLDFP